MNTKILYFAILLAFSAHAEKDYNNKAGIAFRSMAGDYGQTSNDNSIHLQHYLSPVSYKSAKPYAELEFIRVSSVSATISKQRLESDSTSYSSNTPKSLNGTFYNDDFVFGIGTTQFDYRARNKNAPSTGYDTNGSGRWLSLGYFVQENTLISYNYNKTSIKNSPVGNVSPTSDQSLSTTNNGLRATSLVQLDGEKFLAINGQYFVGSNGNGYYGSLRFYPTPSGYIEYGYTSVSGKDSYVDSHQNTIAGGIRVSREWDIRVEKSNYSSPTFHNSGLQFSANYRF